MKKLLRIKAVMERTGSSRPQIYKLMAADLFPRPVQISANMVGWVETEIDAFISEKIAARDAASKPRNKRVVQSEARHG